MCNKVSSFTLIDNSHNDICSGASHKLMSWVDAMMYDWPMHRLVEHG